MVTMTDEDAKNGADQKKKAVDILWRSDDYVEKTTTKYDDGSVETKVERIERMKSASRTSISAEDLKNLKVNQQFPFAPTSSSLSPSEKPKEKKTQER
jgi:hypothetical protein